MAADCCWLVASWRRLEASRPGNVSAMEYINAGHGRLCKSRIRVRCLHLMGAIMWDRSADTAPVYVHIVQDRTRAHWGLHRA